MGEFVEMNKSSKYMNLVNLYMDLTGLDEPVGLGFS